MAMEVTFGIFVWLRIPAEMYVSAFFNVLMFKFLIWFNASVVGTFGKLQILEY